MNNTVIVVDNPVKWKTLVRRQGVEPETAMREDAMPFYMDAGRNNGAFSENEKQAIVSVGALPGTILVRVDKKDGGVRYAPVTENGVSLHPIFEDENVVVHEIVNHFLLLLGARDIQVCNEYEQANFVGKSESQKMSAKGGNKAAGGSAEVSLKNSEAAKSKNSARIESETERSDPDFTAAREWIEQYPWMKGVFSSLLVEAEKGMIHGKKKSTFKLTSCSEIVKKFQRGVDVAAKYQLISGQLKEELSRELNTVVKREDSWTYSMVFP